MDSKEVYRESATFSHNFGMVVVLIIAHYHFSNVISQMALITDVLVYSAALITLLAVQSFRETAETAALIKKAAPKAGQDSWKQAHTLIEANISHWGLPPLPRLGAKNQADRSEEALMFQADLLENVHKSIMVITMNGEIIYYNQEAGNIFNLAPDRMNLLEEVKLPFDKSKINEIRAQMLAGETWEEEQLLQVNGENRTFQHHAHGLCQINASLLAVVVSTDISDLVEARIKSETANIAKNQFLANVTHELRTPMIGILGSVDLMEQGPLYPEQSEYIATIKECSEQLLKTINELLDVSKLELGLSKMISKPVNLLHSIEKSIGIIENAVNEKGLAMHINIDPSMNQMVMLDDLKFRHIILHLLSNAVKFTDIGTIELQAKVETDSPECSWILVRITDTGIGIPSGMIDSVFDPFTQVDGSSQRKYGGTGLGLYTCRRLIELMNGLIWAESTFNLGTSFYIRIPLITPADVASINDSSWKQAASTEDTILNVEGLNSLSSVSVLLVEDNDLNQKIISRMLDKYGFDVHLAANGEESLALLSQNEYDIILMDMQMPVMDGYEATKRIRQNTSWSSLPVIAITANAMSGDAERCLQCGCNSYIPKPFSTEELILEIKKLLYTGGFRSRKNTALFSNELIADLLPEFLESLESMLKDLGAAISNQDYYGILDYSHAIKGTSGMYGFHQISELAASIEQAARDKAKQKVEVLYLQLSTCCQKVILPRSPKAALNNCASQ